MGNRCSNLTRRSHKAAFRDQVQRTGVDQVRVGRYGSIWAVVSENSRADFVKPTLRIVQGIVFHGVRPTQPAYAVAVKQLYASHYFETALDLTVCVRGSDAAGPHGFYLITLKGSQQAGLTGLKGGIVRKVAVDKTHSSLERALASIKQKLESHTQ